MTLGLLVLATLRTKGKVQDGLHQFKMDKAYSVCGYSKGSRKTTVLMVGTKGTDASDEGSQSENEWSEINV